MNAMGISITLGMIPRNDQRANDTNFLRGHGWIYLLLHEEMQLMDIRAAFKDYLDRQRDWYIKQALSNASIAQVLWNDFSDDDHALWVQDQIKSYLAMTPRPVPINSEQSINNEQHPFFVLSGDNSMVSEIRVNNRE